MQADTQKFLTVAEFEQHARGKIAPQTKSFFFSGCFEDRTYQENAEAFKRYRFRPRFLKDVSDRNMFTSVLGHPVSCPFGVSPMSACCMGHPDGDMGIAKACERMKIPYGLSTLSTTSIEDIASGAPNSLRWFQLYVFKERRLTEWLVRRAEVAGFSALVLTVDAPDAGRRLATMREEVQFPSHLRWRNFDDYGECSEIFKPQSPDEKMLDIIARQIDSSLSWRDVRWLISITSLPVVIKGILTAEDAREAVSHGVAAVWVSNHGGRQLDGTPAAIDVLAEVVKAVDARCEVYLDSGVKSGYDVIRGLALGARMVFIGRPVLCGLICDGTEGAYRVLDIVKEEVDNGMALLGARNIWELSRSHVIHESLLPRL